MQEARVAGDRAGAVGDQRAGRAGAQLAEPRLVAVEDVVQDAGAAGLGEELGAEADQAAGGDEVVHPHPAGAVVDHLLHAALAQGQQLGDDADVVLGHVDRSGARRARGRLPSISRMTTCGWPTVSSKPSRRIISTSTASCSSPRPWTSQVSGRSVSCTRSETLPTSSAVEAVLDQAGGELGAVACRPAARC